MAVSRIIPTTSGPAPPTNDPVIADVYANVQQIASKLNAQIVKPGSYTIQAGSVIVINAQGQITSIVP